MRIEGKVLVSILFVRTLFGHQICLYVILSERKKLAGISQKQCSFLLADERFHIVVTTFCVASKAQTQ